MNNDMERTKETKPRIINHHIRGVALPHLHDVVEPVVTFQVSYVSHFLAALITLLHRHEIHRVIEASNGHIDGPLSGAARTRKALLHRGLHPRPAAVVQPHLPGARPTTMRRRGVYIIVSAVGKEKAKVSRFASLCIDLLQVY